MSGSEARRTPGLAATFLVLCLVPAFGADSAGVTMTALRDELARSMAELRMDGMPRPYFIAYTVVDADTLTARASFGASLPTTEARSRRLQVELRVGEPAFDNTNFRDRSFLPTRALTRPLPLAEDYQEIRRQAWLATDAAYKQALEMLAKKRAVLQNETRSQDVADFHAEEPSSFFEEPETTRLPVAEVQDLVRDVSAVFVDMPGVQNSTVNATLGNRRIYYVNSEGTAFTRSDPRASVWVQAQTQAEDGAFVDDFAAAHGQRWDEIDRDRLVAAAREVGDTVAARRAAGDLTRYTGPVLVTGQAAAELFAQVFMPRLLAKRAPDMDPQFRRFASAARNPFVDKLGGRVLPRLLDVVDDPTIAVAGFHGGYPVDDDGVRAGPSTVVEHGILRTLLSSRNPVPGVEASTGNRRGAGPLPSNLLISSERGLEPADLEEEFAQLVAEWGTEFGVVVHRVGNPSVSQEAASSARVIVFGAAQEASVESVNLAYKVFPDGRRELIRNAEFAALSEAAFKDIVAVSKTPTVYTMSYDASDFPAFSFSGVPAAETPRVTISIPDLLFEELTLRKPSENMPRPPVAGHPYFDDERG